MKLFNYTSALMAVVLMVSCVTQQKMPKYLEGAANEAIDKQTSFPELIIQKNDQLAIQVYSDYLPDPKSEKTESNPDLLYNQPIPRGGGAVSASTSANNTSTSGYLVDGEGNIDFPRLGKIHAEGLSKKQLEAEIKKRLTTPVELLHNPTVLIRFQTYKIITLGEFNAPQVLNIPTEKVNIFEAISMAGGITEWGRKDAVKVIREQDGKREMGVVDLSSASVFTSPYYYLRQNDILLIDPVNDKQQVKDETRRLSRISFATSIASTAAVIASIIISITRK
ncbi:polysaccharide biosynthesis/export family protein [Niabella drilacis]|uniref:Polysaccharide export outer membrane protein n=1 Tax=Niabella drilacis (strain DSM 25811 / CCM 8410 / CCUG 62505 / LMG 26954 / E90) TaxID=1285928 RepID=A0A1G6NPW7_NIADE|nr:polysaccharide biosynthesis/export family protein [Niabella drilacis]SDC69711.1 polysaccharide export outer membrane protein [Niabella drilacis]